MTDIEYTRYKLSFFTDEGNTLSPNWLWLNGWGCALSNCKKEERWLHHLNQAPFAKINSTTRKKIFVASYPGEGLILNIAESTQPLAGTQKICYICFSCCAIPILHVNRKKLCTLISWRWEIITRGDDYSANVYLFIRRVRMCL